VDLAPPAFTGGRGLKLLIAGRRTNDPSTARLHRRARIETKSCASVRWSMTAPPAFTGGRGLKHLAVIRVINEYRHRPPSPAGAD